MPGEYRDEGAGGASDRECLQYYRKDLALHAIWEKILNGAVCQPANASVLTRDALRSARETQAESLFDDLLDWAGRAFDMTPPNHHRSPGSNSGSSPGSTRTNGSKDRHLRQPSFSGSSPRSPTYTYADAIDSPAQAGPYVRTEQAVMSARYWAFVLRSRFNAALDLLNASLGEVGANPDLIARSDQLKRSCRISRVEIREEQAAQGPYATEQSASYVVPHAQAPVIRADPRDRVAVWISSLQFYKTEKFAA